MEMPMRNKTQKEQREHLSLWNCWLFNCISKYSFYFSWIYNEKAVKIFLKKSWFNQKVQNACFESIEDGQDMEERAQTFIFIKLVFIYINNWISLCHTWFYDNEAVRKNFLRNLWLVFKALAGVEVHEEWWWRLSLWNLHLFIFTIEKISFLTRFYNEEAVKIFHMVWVRKCWAWKGEESKGAMLCGMGMKIKMQMNET